MFNKGGTYTVHKYLEASRVGGRQDLLEFAVILVFSDSYEMTYFWGVKNTCGVKDLFQLHVIFWWYSVSKLRGKNLTFQHHPEFDILREENIWEQLQKDT